MNQLEKRLETTEIELLRLKMEKLEEELEDVRSEKKILPKIKDIASILTPLIVAGIGFYATYSISSAIQREQLQLSHLTAIQQMMEDLSKPDIELSEAEAAAVSLAAFGPTAVVPLIHELQASGDVRPIAAEEGLRAVAFRYPESTCQILVEVLKNRTGLFSWQAHRSVIRLLGDIGCDDVLDVLNKYKAMLDSPNALEVYPRIVRENPAPSQKSIDKLKGEMNKTVDKIKRK